MSFEKLVKRPEGYPSRCLHDICDLLPMWNHPDPDTRRTYWVLLGFRVAIAMRAGCTNQEIFDATVVARGLKHV